MRQVSCSATGSSPASNCESWSRNPCQPAAPSARKSFDRAVWVSTSRVRPPTGVSSHRITALPTSEKDEVEVSDHGTVTGFTIITPVAYYGQEETEPFVYASVLLDGASGNLGGQDIVGIPRDQVHSGLRVRAVWKPKSERSGEGVSNRGWGSVASVIDAFEPTGEPDMERSKYEEHIF